MSMSVNRDTDRRERRDSENDVLRHPVDAMTGINFNRYAYAGNSPYANYDPSGRELVCVSLPYGCVGHREDTTPEEAAALLGGIATVATLGTGGLIIAGTETGLVELGIIGAVASAGKATITRSPSDLGMSALDGEMAILANSGQLGSPYGTLLLAVNLAIDMCDSFGCVASNTPTSPTPDPSASNSSPQVGPVLNDPVYSDPSPDTQTSDPSTAPPAYELPNYDPSQDPTNGN